MIRQRTQQAEERRMRGRRLGTNDAFWKDDVEFFTRKEDFILQESNRTLGYDFARNSFRMDRPLQYQAVVKLSDFERAIQRYGDSKDNKMISLPATIRELCLEGQRVGLNSEQYCQLLVEFTKKFYPRLLPPAQTYLNERDGRKVHELLVQEVSIDQEKQSVQNAKKKIVRKVGEPVSEALASVKSLAHQLLKILTDHDVNTITEKASKIALNDVKFYVSGKVLQEYNKFCYNMASQGRTVTYHRSVNQLIKIEEDNPTWKPTQDMSSGAAIDIQQVLNITNVESHDRAKRPRSATPYRGRSSSSDRRSRDRDGGRGRRGGERDSRAGRRPRTRSSSFSHFTARESSRDFSRGTPSRDFRTRRDSFTQFRDRSSSTGDRERRRSPFQSPRRSFTPDRRTPSHSPYRSREYGGGVRERSRPRSGSTQSQSGLTNPMDAGLCTRCGSGGHRGDSCPRFKNRYEGYCFNCAKVRNIKLRHSAKECHLKESVYSHPLNISRGRK